MGKGGRGEGIISEGREERGRLGGRRRELRGAREGARVHGAEGRGRGLTDDGRSMAGRDKDRLIYPFFM